MNQTLFAVIREARRRWRMRVFLVGAAIVGIAALALVLVTTFGMDRMRFDPTAVLVFRLAAWGGLGYLAWRFLLRPLTRRVSDEQVALYLEEHAPGFGGRLLSAVEFAGRVDGITSRKLVDRLVREAVERCETFPAWRGIERPRVRRASGALAGTALAGLAVLLIGPGFVSYGAPMLLRPFGGTGAGNPYAVVVTPGDTLLPRGADLTVTARLENFDAEPVELVFRGGTADWERWSMPPDEASGARRLLVFAIDSVSTYFVEAAGVRSPVFTITVQDLPYVQAVEVEYHFPAYTGLRPRRDEGGDIAALAGTRVTVRVTPTLAVTEGALALGSADTVPLVPDTAGTLHATLTVRDPGGYRVVFPDPDGRPVVGSPDYFIDVLEDQPPLVRLARPGRDLTVTSIEEVFLEAEAEDDFGIRRLEVRYRVNGGAERSVPLYGPGARARVVAGHTLFLEEFGLQPGDFVSYYARAADTRPEAAPVLSDIYFLSIRPFDRAFREAEQQGTMNADGGMGVGALSERQREIVAATFRVMRDRAAYTEDEIRDHLTTLVLSQGRLREDVETLSRRIASRGIVRLDSTMAPVADALSQAVAAMREAEDALGRGAPDDALAPEQRALQQLQRAEAVFRREQQVAPGRPDGGGGGGGPLSDELSELFELEADRLRNQYEQADRDVRERVNQEIDETLEKLRELARRQQQETERRQALERQGAAAAGVPSDAQRRLADAAEAEARRLERLARERAQPDLREAARRVQAAADAMRRAAAGNSGAANAALDRLEQARQRLERRRQAGLAEDVDDALERARRLAAQQEEVQRDVTALDQVRGDARAERVDRLAERKALMAGEVAALEAQLERLGREAQAERPQAAERLRAAARGIRQQRLEDKIRYSRGVIEQRSGEYARRFEESIQQDLDTLRARVAAAAAAVHERPPEARVAETLDRTREVAEALESLEERVRGARTGDTAAAAEDRLRQLAREVGERRRELQDIRNRLHREGVETGELEDLGRALGRYDNPRALGTPRALDDLARVIVPGIKEFEFALRRVLLEQRDGAGHVAGADRVAPEYRAMVEEYYRKLGRRR